MVKDLRRRVAYRAGLILLVAAALPHVFCGPFSEISRADRQRNNARLPPLEPSTDGGRVAPLNFTSSVALAAFTAACLVLSTLSTAAVAQDPMMAELDQRPYIERNPPQPPPDDDKAPDIAPEERQRRRTSPSKDVSSEEWYEYGKDVFVAKCAGCHPGGMNQVRVSKGLNLEDLERWGFLKEPQKITEIIRYGKGTMPGFAKDCPEKSGYQQCGVVVPLDEATLIDVEDFMMNRANSGWRGRG
ncbi:unnamed protein product [Cladocopium goreaui]|uniref:Cytochrome c6 n=1 Tax=Cladocopium goreaui TaxID=2562237 RepID=A0A9P1DFS1_9DINO|nr:unnamed protein product [Cladocopium goreaui]